MSYRVNASCGAGAVSVPVSSSDDAWAKADALASKGHKNIVIIDAGTGMPVRRGSTISKGILCKPVSLGGFPDQAVALRAPEQFESCMLLPESSKFCGT